MKFDLQDGQPPVSFTLKPEDAERFMALMAECDGVKKEIEDAKEDMREAQAISDQLQEDVKWLRATHETSAARDVLAERARQIGREGWTTKHDDAHSGGEMAQAAACYALGTPAVRDPFGSGDVVKLWPYGNEWWKPRDRRSNLVRAAALLLAEIERLDRAAAAQAQGVTNG
jgi:hypothetical protein